VRVVAAVLVFFVCGRVYLVRESTKALM